MIRNCLKLFVFLFFLNSVSQNIETIELERDQEISSFINDYEISPGDFFILNTDYTENRFNHSSSDLTQKLIKGDLLRVFEKSGINQYKQTSFITHKIKRNFLRSKFWESTCVADGASECEDGALECADGFSGWADWDADAASKCADGAPKM